MNGPICIFQCQEGYEYGPPPEQSQLKPGTEAEVAEGGGAARPQGAGQVGGEDHSHANSDDPLAWLKESIQVCNILMHRSQYFTFPR
jgi:hypothetical protein